MKKIFALVFIFSTISFCCAQEGVNTESPAIQNEIYLDTGFKTKEYKLQKIDYNNPAVKNNDEDTDMPFNFVSSPLQLLKQYQTDNY